jgi:hypothetical protein
MLIVPSFIWTAVWWVIAWSHIPLLSEYSFFPLWLGYVFSVNAVNTLLFKDSLLSRMRWSFIWLFVISIPLWWFFEYLNAIVQNWHYLYRPISELHYVLQSSIDFSTVVPAVLSSIFLFERLLGKEWKFKKINVTKFDVWLIVAVGIVSFALMPFFPSQTFPLVWIAPLLIIDPINYAFGFPSILQKMREAKWSQIVVIAIATLFTGFWWEMWNFFSYPKWFYTIPYVGFWKIFEMPIFGYGGYLFFGLIIWSYASFVFSTFGKTASVKESGIF